LLLLGTVSCDTGVDTTTISTENCELPLTKIYENSSLDHSLFCTFDPRSNAGLLRERTPDEHDHNASDYCNGAAAYVYPNAHYGGLLRRRPLIAARLVFGRKHKLTFPAALLWRRQRAEKRNSRGGSMAREKAF
jgi:hypothetical protein